MDRGIITLKKGEGRTLKAGGLWVYDNEIASMEGCTEDGAIVSVHDFDEYPMGCGFINSRSKIRVRLLSRSENVNIDREFFRRRLEAAWDYRKKTVDISSCRIVFGEADLLPGLVIDKYSDVLVIQISALGMEQFKLMAVQVMKEVLLADGICVRGIFERSDGKYRKQEGLPVVKDFITDPFDTMVPICENGVQMLVDVKNGQKTGYFLDQKYNRLAIQELSKGMTVLDCFTHTGSFALNAAKGGAAHVTAVDASALAISQAQKNAGLNEFEDIIDFRTADVLDLLPELEREGRKYDLVILDPPAFTKSRNSVKHAMKGYRDINIRGMKLVKNGGFLATCSCSSFMTYELFTRMLHQAASSAHRIIRQVQYRTQSPDHPILWSADESYYLKFYILQITDPFQIRKEDSMTGEDR